MNWVVFHQEDWQPDNTGPAWKVVETPVLAQGLVHAHEGDATRPGERSGVAFVLPQTVTLPPSVQRHRLSEPLSPAAQTPGDSWLAISNGRFVQQVDAGLLARLTDRTDAQVLILSIDSRLRGYREQIRLTRQGHVAGVRRYFEDGLVPMPVTGGWPHRILIHPKALTSLQALPLASFEAFMEVCQQDALTVKAYAVAGSCWDLTRPEEVLSWIETLDPEALDVSGYRLLSPDPEAAGPRVAGNVWVGRDVRIDPKAVLLGPVIIEDHARVGEGAVIDTAIVGPRVTVEAGTHVHRQILWSPVDDRPAGGRTAGLGPDLASTSPFRQWSRFSYVNTVKRLMDVVVSAVVLILFLPLIPILALAIKVNSPGPVFYKARRQGLGGKEFHCLKFRTMKVGADKLQDMLRTMNEVDGPQFKMVDDPRISTVGHFLRETYIDEIPQFFNVFLGQMSLVGPRPSPRAENTQCPRWRDARLSVRPGITGLWQLLRTREPLRDFQEWIHYDVEYVRRVSWFLDIWICWRTFLQMLGKFVEQF